MEIKEETFPDWTSYDSWLVENYAEYSVISLNEIDGKIKASYAKKEEFNKWQAEEEEKNKNQKS